jgi:uncharacterized protein (DUF1501 family)
MKPISSPNILTRRSFLSRAAYTGVAASAAAHTIRDLRLINTAMAAQGPVTGYKALVCLFMAGGNDANNMLIPTDTSTFEKYTAIRGNMAMPFSSLLKLKTGTGGGAPDYQDSDGHTLALHPAMTGVQQLFAEKKVAIVKNVGTLVRPTTRAQYLANSKFYRPPQLFSHSDQVTQWQTSVPDQPPATGWGGRVADIVNSVANPNGSISMSVSLSGANTFEIGNVVSQYHVADTGAVSLTGNLMTGTGARARVLRDILGLNHNNLQRKAYADVVERSISTGELLNTSIAPTLDPTDSPASYTTQNAAAPWRWNTGLSGIYTTAVQPNGLGGFPDTPLGRQMKMIARIIQARGNATSPEVGKFNMARQIFYCQIGGFDTHAAQVQFTPSFDPVLGTQRNLLNDVSQCMIAFQRAMEQLGVSDQVTAFTASDFARTFISNSQGTDHAWGSHHFVMGGAVNGGETFGSMPTFALSGPNDTASNGGWIPTLAVDQHAATLAKWFGVDSSVMANIFPNLSRFSGTQYGSDVGFML